MDEEKQIRKLVERIIKTQEVRDAQAMIGLHNPNAFILGTGKMEILDTYDKIKDGWVESLAIDDLRVTDYKILNLKVNGDVAWVIFVTDVSAIIQGKKLNLDGIRTSIVFERINGTWLISQWHNSVYELGLESKSGWASEDDIRSKISELIEKLGMDPKVKDKETEIKEYLIKAKALLE